MSTERGPDVPTSGEMVRRLQLELRRLTQQLHRLNDVVGAHLDLLPGDLEVLDRIGRDGPMSPGQIASTIGMHPATVTGMLDRLEKGGWLVRRPDPDDRRRVIVEVVTDRSGELLRLYGPMNRALGRLCAGYSPAELTIIVDFLEKAASAGTDATTELRRTADDR